MQRPDDPPGDPTDFFTGNSSVMRRPVNTELVVALVVVILIAAGAITYLLLG